MPRRAGRRRRSPRCRLAGPLGGRSRRDDTARHAPKGRRCAADRSTRASVLVQRSAARSRGPVTRASKAPHRDAGPPSRTTRAAAPPRARRPPRSTASAPIRREAHVGRIRRRPRSAGRCEPARRVQPASGPPRGGLIGEQQRTSRFGIVIDTTRSRQRSVPNQYRESSGWNPWAQPPSRPSNPLSRASSIRSLNRTHAGWF